MSRPLTIQAPPLIGITRNIREIVSELRGYEIRESYKGIRDAAILCALEVADSIDRHFHTPDSDRLNRELIGSLLDLIHRWESWAETATFESPITPVFHSMLIRYTKGMCKAFRIWRIDRIQ